MIDSKWSTFSEAAIGLGMSVAMLNLAAGAGEGIVEMTTASRDGLLTRH